MHEDSIVYLSLLVAVDIYTLSLLQTMLPSVFPHMFYFTDLCSLGFVLFVFLQGVNSF